MSANQSAFDPEAFFNGSVKGFVEELAAISDAIDTMSHSGSLSADDYDPQLLQRLTAAIHRSREECRAAGTAIGGDKILLAALQKRFRDTIAPWFDQSWFMARAKSKPRGYPGDFEMLTAIYDGQVKSTGFGAYLDRYFLQTDLARAVCSRLDCIKKYLIKEVSRRATRVAILNVASGPGREYSSAFPTGDSVVSLTCVDTDQAALEYLKSRVDSESTKDLDVHCVCYNALKMTAPERNLQAFGENDIIYSVGLCDYIPDRYMIRILDGWRKSVRPDGIVYVAFKDALRYVAAEYQWHVDWHFYERTEEDCFQLFEQAGFKVQEMTMFRDETGIIMNFVAGPNALGRTDADSTASILNAPRFPMSDSDEAEADLIDETVN